MEDRNTICYKTPRFCQVFNCIANTKAATIIFDMYKYDSNIHKTISRDQARSFDLWAIRETGIAGVVLMENAGRSCAEFISLMTAEWKNRQVCIFAGIGNNGGDGFVIARHLANKGISVRTVICGNPAKLTGDAKTNYEIICRLRPTACPQGFFEIHSLDLSGNVAEQVQKFTADCNIIVDAIFGTGLSGILRGGFDVLINEINRLGKPVVAIDIPSGLDCDTGMPLGTAIRAKATITFIAAKNGFASPDSIAYTGEVYVACIGVVAHNCQNLRNKKG